MTRHLKKLSNLHHKSLQLILPMSDAPNFMQCKGQLLCHSLYFHCRLWSSSVSQRQPKRFWIFAEFTKLRRTSERNGKGSQNFKCFPPHPRLAFLAARVTRSYNQTDEQTINTGSGHEDPPESLLCVRNPFHWGAAECWSLFSSSLDHALCSRAVLQSGLPSPTVMTCSRSAS